MKSSQKGQSSVEFVIALGAIGAFLIGIPMVAKVGYARLLASQATDYAAWRVQTTSIRDAKVLSREVNDRYFGHTAAAVQSRSIINMGMSTLTNKHGESLVKTGGVAVTVNSSRDRRYEFGTRGLSPVSRSTGELRLNRQTLHQVSVEVPLHGVDVLDTLPKTFTIRKSMAVVSDQWSGQSPLHIRDQIRQTRTMYPYENGLGGISQSNMMRTVNTFSRIFGETQGRRTDLLDADVVPRDRVSRE